MTTRRNMARADRSSDTSCAAHHVPPAVVEPGSAPMSPALREALVTALANWLVRELTEVAAAEAAAPPAEDATARARTESREEVTGN